MNTPNNQPKNNSTITSGDLTYTVKSVERSTANIAGDEKQLMDCPEMEAIANTIMAENGFDFGPFEVGYYLQCPNITAKTVSKVTKCNIELKHFSGNDALIEVSEEVWNFLDAKIKKALVFQNLMKIRTSYKAKTQEWSLKILQTEYSTFHKLNDEFGSDWYKAIQGVVSSINDLDAKEESEVKI